MARFAGTASTGVGGSKGQQIEWPSRGLYMEVKEKFNREAYLLFSASEHISDGYLLLSKGSAYTGRAHSAPRHLE